MWVVGDIWPKVLDRAPEARLRLVGGGASDELRAVVDASDGVELAGFVDDLARGVRRTRRSHWSRCSRVPA